MATQKQVPITRSGASPSKYVEQLQDEWNSLPLEGIEAMLREYCSTTGYSPRMFKMESAYSHSLDLNEGYENPFRISHSWTVIADEKAKVAFSDPFIDEQHRLRFAGIKPIESVTAAFSAELTRSAQSYDDDPGGPIEMGSFELETLQSFDLFETAKWTNAKDSRLKDSAVSPLSDLSRNVEDGFKGVDRNEDVYYKTTHEYLSWVADALVERGTPAALADFSRAGPLSTQAVSDAFFHACSIGRVEMAQAIMDLNLTPDKAPEAYSYFSVLRTPEICGWAEGLLRAGKLPAVFAEESDFFDRTAGSALRANDTDLLNKALALNPPLNRWADWFDGSEASCREMHAILKTASSRLSDRLALPALHAMTQVARGRREGISEVECANLIRTLTSKTMLLSNTGPYRNTTLAKASVLAWELGDTPSAVSLFRMAGATNVVSTLVFLQRPADYINAMPDDGRAQIVEAFLKYHTTPGKPISDNSKSCVHAGLEGVVSKDKIDGVLTRIERNEADFARLSRDLVGAAQTFNPSQSAARVLSVKLTRDLDSKLSSLGETKGLPGPDVRP